MERALATVSEWRLQLIALPLSQYILNLSPRQEVEFDSPNAESQIKLYAEVLKPIRHYADLIVHRALITAHG